MQEDNQHDHLKDKSEIPEAAFEVLGCGVQRSSDAPLQNGA